MYQTREGGALRFFETAQELLDAKDSLRHIDKLSFEGPDGARIRLVYQGNGLFSVTIWNVDDDNKNTTAGFEVFP